MTDNAFGYVKNRSSARAAAPPRDPALRTRPYTPRTNGKVERYQQTLQREWAYALEYASSAGPTRRAATLERHYNERRTHSALGNRPPLATRSGGLADLPTDFVNG